MLTTLFMAGALAQSLDADGLRAAEQAEDQEYQHLASTKRLESIARLEGLMARDLTPETLAEMRLRLADLSYEEGRYRGDLPRIGAAATLYQRIVTETPQYARVDQAQFFLGACSWALGQADQARGEWGQVAKLYPESSFVADAYVGIGDVASIHDEDWTTALVAYRKAAQFRGERTLPYATYRLGWAFHHLGDIDQAQARWIAAREMNNDHVAAAATQDLLDVLGWTPPVAVAAVAEVEAVRGCEAMEQIERRRMIEDPVHAPLAQLRIVTCWTGEDPGRARAELARLEAVYGPKSAWARGRSKDERREARTAIAQGRRLVH